MKLSLSCLVLASSFCAAACAHASTITGTVYEGTPGGAVTTTVPTSTGTATYTVTSAGINYASPPANYTVRAFTNMPGFSNPTGTFDPTANLNNTELIITGSLKLATGDVLSIVHDDGAILVLNGTTVISSPGPNTAQTDGYTVASNLAGTDTFTLYYMETGGKPADLTFTDNNSIVGIATPEPSSLILLGTGLATAAGFARRRFSRAV